MSTKRPREEFVDAYRFYATAWNPDPVSGEPVISVQETFIPSVRLAFNKVDGVTDRDRRTHLEDDDPAPEAIQIPRAAVDQLEMLKNIQAIRATLIGNLDAAVRNAKPAEEAPGTIVSYKFPSDKRWSSVVVRQPHPTILDLKRAIVAESLCGHAVADFDLIVASRGGCKWAETDLIRNVRYTVRRVPASAAQMRKLMGPEVL